MKNYFFILVLLMLTSCSTLRLGHVDYIQAKNSFGDVFEVPIPTLTYELSGIDSPYHKIYFYYGGYWHLGKDWITSLEYPFRTEKEQKRFYKKYKRTAPVAK